MQDFHTYPAPAKLNLFLHIVGQRADGYHLLQSVFQLLDRHDVVYLKPTTDGRISRPNGPDSLPEAQDLCVRAAHLLQQETACPLGVEIRLEKNIPMGGGLGGGSSDAATVLLALNRLWSLNLPRTRLLEMGLRLGADVPVFIFGENAWAEGVGEQLQAINLEPMWYVVLTPSVHVSTAQVFASKELTRNTNPIRIAAFSRGFGHNDLESVVCSTYPAVASSLNWLKQFGDARMSGSGASVFAAFPDEATVNHVLAQRPQGLRGFVAKGLDRHPLHDFAA